VKRDMVIRFYTKNDNTLFNLLYQDLSNNSSSSVNYPDKFCRSTAAYDGNVH